MVRENGVSPVRRAWPMALTVAACCVLVGCSAMAAAGEPDVYRKGGVRLYKKGQRIEMDGEFAMAEGPLELLVCGKGGKDWESVIVCDVNPQVLHLFMLAMGLKPAPENAGPRFQGDPERAPAGDPVEASVKWTVVEKGKKVEKEVPAEHLCWNAIDKRVMRRTPWLFAGSKFQKHPETKKKVYWANVEKSLITIFRDPYAVLDLPLPLGANDEAYVVNTRLVPKPGTACTIVLRKGTAMRAAKNAAGARLFTLDVTKGGRVLVDGVEPSDVAIALKTIAWYAPKDTCQVTIDHGAPPAAAAKAFEALRLAGLTVEGVRTVRVQPELTSAVTIEVRGDTIRVNGKELSDDQANVVVQEMAMAKKNAGVTLKVQRDAGAGALVRALAACRGKTDAAFRVEWFEGRWTAGKRPQWGVPETEKNRVGGRRLTVKIDLQGRASIAGARAEDLGHVLKTVRWYAPRDTCQVAMAHGAPAAEVATVFEQVGESMLVIERVKTVDVRPGVIDTATIVVAGNKVLFQGKEISDRQAKAVIPEAVKRSKGSGVTVKLGADGGLWAVVRALHAAAAADGAVLRLVWTPPPPGK